MVTLFDKLGGPEAVSFAVDSFYKNVMNDERINHFFADVDLDVQSRHLKMYLIHVFGGLSKYNGKSVKAAHKHLVDKMGLNDNHFDALLENLQKSLDELGLSGQVISEVRSVFESTRNEVLCKCKND